jgi:F-type H+-transporting ATPase subunit epsilon
MAQLTCIVVTPEAMALETTADFVALPLYDGELGVLPGHSPMIGRLGYNEMRIRTGSSVQHYYVDGGFVQVVNDVVTVLTSRAVLASKINEKAAHEQLEGALHRPANTDELAAIRDRMISQARGQIRVAKMTR